MNTPLFPTQLDGLHCCRFFLRATPKNKQLKKKKCHHPDLLVRYYLPPLAVFPYVFDVCLSVCLSVFLSGLHLYYFSGRSLSVIMKRSRHCHKKKIEEKDFFFAVVVPKHVLLDSRDITAPAHLVKVLVGVRCGSGKNNNSIGTLGQFSSILGLFTAKICLFPTHRTDFSF